MGIDRHLAPLPDKNKSWGLKFPPRENMSAPFRMHANIGSADTAGLAFAERNNVDDDYIGVANLHSVWKSGSRCLQLSTVERCAIAVMHDGATRRTEDAFSAARGRRVVCWPRSFVSPARKPGRRQHQAAWSWPADVLPLRWSRSSSKPIFWPSWSEPRVERSTAEA
ncbi:hypothetical protein D3C85_1439190 [compost metagenome]